MFVLALTNHLKLKYLNILPGDGVTGAGVTGAGVTGAGVTGDGVVGSSHSTTGSLLGSAVPLHQHLQSFPTKPSPAQVLLGQLATMFVLVIYSRFTFVQSR